MTDTLFALVAVWGVPVVFLATFLSCLALPVPSSFVMLAGGAFAASGDLPLEWVVAAALAGALLGDQVGYWAGRRLGPRLLARLEGSGRASAVMGRARGMLERWGGPGVFVTRWLFSPVGPWVNPLAGAGGMGWWRFSGWGAAGEAVWVGLYVGLGMAFGAQIGLLAELSGNLIGALTGAAVTALLGWQMLRRLRRPAAGG